MPSTTFIGVRLNDVGQPILREGASAEERSAFFKLFWAGTAGQRFRPFATKSSQALLDEYLEKRFFNVSEITLQQFEGLVALMLDTNTFPSQQPRVVPATVEYSRPRNPDGTFMSDFEIWANVPGRSSSEIHSRAKADPDGFGAWYRARLVEETVQDGPYKIAGAATREPTDDDFHTLYHFVECYKAAPAASLRPQAGFSTLAGVKYTPRQFDTLVTAAAEAGLL